MLVAGIPAQFLIVARQILGGTRVRKTLEMQVYQVVFLGIVRRIPAERVVVPALVIADQQGSVTEAEDAPLSPRLSRLQQRVQQPTAPHMRLAVEAMSEDCFAFAAGILKCMT